MADSSLGVGEATLETSDTTSSTINDGGGDEGGGVLGADEEAMLTDVEVVDVNKIQLKTKQNKTILQKLKI